jgi:hypothetical protein
MGQGGGADLFEMISQFVCAWQFIKSNHPAVPESLGGAFQSALETYILDGNNRPTSKLADAAWVGAC